MNNKNMCVTSVDNKQVESLVWILEWVGVLGGLYVDECLYSSNFIS